MKKLEVATVVGTRPEIIRLSRVIAKLDQFCHHKLIHTGQNYDYELNAIFFEDLGIRQPDYFLNAAGNNGADTIGNVIKEVDKKLEQLKPEALLVLGDTNSCMAAIPAKRRKIPIFHMEAGNRCFDMRVPEEINRRIVDHCADVNLTYSQIARDYLINEGLPADRIIKTGSPMLEVLNYYRDKINGSNILKQLNLQERCYWVISAHREENIDSEVNLNKLVTLVNTIAEKYQHPVIFSTHPRTRKRLDAVNANFNELVVLLKPLGFSDYNKLQLSAKAVLSDSGTITEESSILQFPALNIREAHERPEGMEEGSVMMVGLELDRTLQALALLEDVKLQRTCLVHDYNVENVSDKVVKIIISYRDYIMRTVWRQYK